jgi:hypothetical protein
MLLEEERDLMSIIPIKIGQSIKLSWDFNNAQSVTIDQGIGAVPRIGDVTLSPTTDITYTLIASNYLGDSIQRQVTITVTYPPKITGISPDQGAPSDTITITGLNFDPIDVNNLVEFQGSNGSRLSSAITFASSTELQVTVPLAVLSGPIQVTTDLQPSNEANFIVDKINDFIITNTGFYPLSDPHIEGCSFPYKGRAYLVGGQTDLVDFFDSKTKIINNTESLNAKRSGFPIAWQVAGSVYVIGGNDQSNFTQRLVEKFDLATESWSILGSTSLFPDTINGTNRCGSVLGSDIYFFTDTETLKFNTNTETWVTGLTAKPSSSFLCKAITKDNLIYVLGSGSDNKDVYSYNPGTDSWVKLLDSPAPLEGNTLNIVGNFMVTTGGRADGSLIQIYNSNNDTWRSSFLGEIASLPPESLKQDHLAEVLNGELYLFGGNTNQIVKLTPI